MSQSMKRLSKVEVQKPVDEWKDELCTDRRFTIPFAIFTIGTHIYGIKISYEVLPQIYGFNLINVASLCIGGMDHIRDAMIGAMGFTEDSPWVKHNPLFYMDNKDTKDTTLAWFLRVFCIGIPLSLRMLTMGVEYYRCGAPSKGTPDWMRYVAIATVPFIFNRMGVETLTMTRGSKEWMSSHTLFHFTHYLIFLHFAYKFPLFANYSTVLLNKSGILQ